MLHLDPVPQVWGITGNLGGGKSLSAVCLAAVAMSRGYFVVSNITLNLDELALEYGSYVRRLYQHFSFDDENFDPFALPTGSPRGTNGGKRVLVIMDECAEWIDQYSSANTNPRIKKFLSWLRHSSKRSQDVILVVQRLDYLNKNIRLLISKWLIVDDLRVWRCPVLKMRFPFMAPFVMQRVFDRNRKLIQGPCLVRKSTFGRFYRTAECLNAEGASVNYEYVTPIKSNFPFIKYVVAYVFSLYVLLLMLLKYNASVKRQTSYIVPELRHIYQEGRNGAPPERAEKAADAHASAGGRQQASPDAARHGATARLSRLYAPAARVPGLIDAARGYVIALESNRTPAATPRGLSCLYIA